MNARDPELLRASVLRDDERERFLSTHGYLVVPEALSRHETAELCAAVDRHSGAGPKPGQLSLNVADILGRDDAFLGLIDNPRVFPKLWGLLGWNLWVQHSHFVVTPPQPPLPAGASFPYGWHRDGGAIHRDVALDALLLVKVGFYLNDVALDGGPTYFLDAADPRAPIPAGTERPAHARPLLVPAGTAVLFGNRAIHSLRSPNTSAATRRAVFLQYGYRWLQPLDRSTPPPTHAALDPIRRQLLGLTTTFTDERYKGSEGRSGRFLPSAEDVPLFAFLKALLGDDAPRYVARSLDDAELRR